MNLNMYVKCSILVFFQLDSAMSSFFVWCKSANWEGKMVFYREVVFSKSLYLYGEYSWLQSAFFLLVRSKKTSSNVGFSSC